MDENDVLVEYAKKYDAFINVKEAAEIAHVPIATIHSWSSMGRFDGFKRRAGRHLLLFRDTFIEMLLNNRPRGPYS